MWWPFVEPVPSADQVDDLVDAFGESAMRLAMLNLTLGDAVRGQHGLVAIESERATFRDNLAVAADIARRLEASVLTCHYGNVRPTETRGARDETARENLALAAEVARDANLTVVIEPLNRIDFPDYGLGTVGDGVDLIASLPPGHAPVRVLLDVYHVARAGEDPAATIARHGSHVGHVQVGDVPGRGAPGTGSIDFAAVFASLRRVGYDGYVGLEYRPGADDAATFGWLRA
jgi:hydroxypyruvate isomerase